MYVSTGIPNSEGRIARVDRSSGVVTAIAATGYNEIELLADPARNLLYASDGIPAAEPTVRKLDAGAPGTPQPSAFVQTTGPGQFNRLSLSPSGLLIFVSSGDVLNTEDLSPATRVTPGVPWASEQWHGSLHCQRRARSRHSLCDDPARDRPSRDGLLEGAAATRQSIRFRAAVDAVARQRPVADPWRGSAMRR